MRRASDGRLRPDGLIACQECDALHRLRPLEGPAVARCTRCGARLYRVTGGGIDRPLALTVAALGALLLANLFPFIALELEGRVEENLVVSGALALWREGMPELAVLVLATSVIFPLLVLCGMLWLLVPLRLGRRPPAAGAVYRLLREIGPWALLGVFLLGALIGFVKLADLATVIPGVSMYAFAALIVLATAARESFDPALLWPRAGPPARPLPAGASARELGLVSCPVCALLIAAPPPGGRPRCPRCTSPLHGARKPDSIARTWALVISAALLIGPANLYPVMTVIRFGRGDPSTILAGVVHLIEAGAWGLGLIVLFASVVVPVAKLVILSFLLLSVQRGSRWRPRERTRLYRLAEVIGAWSMVDVFLVGVLTALVRLDALATIRPELGVSFFAAVVVLTMLAAHSFDPRLIWDRAGRAR